MCNIENDRFQNLEKFQKKFFLLFLRKKIFFFHYHVIKHERSLFTSKYHLSQKISQFTSPWSGVAGRGFFLKNGASRRGLRGKISPARRPSFYYNMIWQLSTHKTVGVNGNTKLVLPLTPFLEPMSPTKNGVNTD